MEGASAGGEDDGDVADGDDGLAFGWVCDFGQEDDFGFGLDGAAAFGIERCADGERESSADAGIVAGVGGGAVCDSGDEDWAGVYENIQPLINADERG